MTRRITRALAALAASAVLLTACSGLPTEGLVQPGDQVDQARADVVWQFTPDGPSVGASPAEIVLGFLEAGESPVASWDIAREFLTEDFAEEWRPDTQVTIEDIGERSIADFSGDAEAVDDARAGELRVSVTPTAMVSENGQYVSVSGGARALDFALQRNPDGEWRIAAAPDGVVVASGRFDYIFSEHVLYFFASGSDRLVPDVRWFPNTTGTASRIARTLVEGGPAEWLDGAVTSAFEGVRLGRQSVSVSDDGTATVDLAGLVVERSERDRGRMAVQLEASLGGIGVREVEVTYADRHVVTPDVPVTPTVPDARALVMTEDDFGFLGREIDPIPGISDVVASRFTPTAEADDPATSITVAADHSQAAVQSEAGTLWRLRDDGTFDDLDYGESWLPPALDPSGFIWSVSSEDPSLMWVWGAGGDPFALEGVSDLTDVDDVRMSRDGARLAIAGAVDDRPVLVVAGIARDDEGTPAGISGATEVTELPRRADVVGWVGEETIAVAIPGDNRTTVIEQTVGGTSERLTASFGVDMMTYGNPQSNERLLTADGHLYVRKITTWQQAGEGISVLATQLGAPDA